MDDFNLATLNQSKNEWGSRLVNILTPFMIEGLRSIFDESFRLCKENGETNKYLMTFQNFISRIPKWNSNIIEAERARIIEKSGCSYLEDLVTCVYIIQLKLLTAIRVGQKQKKIDINIPKIDDFIHKVYITIARKIYKYVYLFEVNIPPLQTQKNNRELELLVQESILNTIRESIPIEAILRAYMDETTEEEYIEEIKEQLIENKTKPIASVPVESTALGASVVASAEASEASEESSSFSSNTNAFNEVSKLAGLGSIDTAIKFNDTDFVRDTDNNENLVNAPKNIDRLEEISAIRYNQRKQDEEDDDDGSMKLNISDQTVSLNDLEVYNMDEPNLEISDLEEFTLPDLMSDLNA
jgi:hypothetical protein